MGTFDRLPGPDRRSITMKIHRLLCTLTLSFAAAAAFAQTAVLRVSAIPDEAPTELQRKFKPLGEYLQQETGLKVEFTPVSDYAAVVEGLASGKIDLAWLGGFTYVQARIRTHGGAVPLVQRAEDEKFTSKFIVPADSPAKTLADLKGKTFVFGSASSTSGHLMPRYNLMQAGIDPDKDFKSVAFSGAHDATVAFVASGRAEAGALNASVWDKLVEAHNPNVAKVRVLATTAPFFDYNWTVRPGMDAALANKLTQAFLKLDPNNPAHKEVLSLQRASRFVPTKPSNYDGIEAAAKAAHLL
jgi:phosphonate transport system substrate-binding protein